MLSCLPAALPSSYHPFPNVPRIEPQEKRHSLDHNENNLTTASSSSRHSSTSTESSSNAISPFNPHMNLQPAPPHHYGADTAYHGVFTPPGCSSSGRGAGGDVFNVSPGSSSAHLPSPMVAHCGNNGGKRSSSPRLDESMKRDHMHGKIWRNM